MMRDMQNLQGGEMKIDYEIIVLSVHITVYFNTYQYILCNKLRLLRCKFYFDFFV